MTGGAVRSIVLPCDEVFRNLRNAKRFAIDIGGSLAKLAYCSTVVKPRKFSVISCKEAHLENDTKDEDGEVKGMRLHFIKFETKYIESCLEFMQQKLIDGEFGPAKIVKATGGGAYKYTDLITEKLGLRVDKVDEMECLIKGCNFLLRNIPDESFTYHHHQQVKYKFKTVDPCKIFPYLLVNIGSGVSILKVENDNKYERVGGSSLGGGTFWGLGSLLTDAKGFDQLMQMAEDGDHRNVDMLVSDIYGGAYKNLGLPPELIASSFGKTVRASQEQASNRSEFEQQDIARSLLLTISNCIGQSAVLYAQLEKMPRIYFGGYFIRNHPITMRTISYAIDYWSKSTIQAQFLRHEGYLGAIGAFLKGAEEDSKEHAIISDLSSHLSWNEHYAGCSGLGGCVPAAFLCQNYCNIDLLEMDSVNGNLVPFPLLRSAADYVPDTTDLTQDDEAREYWLTCLENNVQKTVERAVDSQPENSDAAERADNFKHRYLQHLRLLRQRPFAYGCLNMRSLLDLNEQLLNEFYFPDIHLNQKLLENDNALQELPAILEYMDSLNWDDRQLELVMGLLAGNVFDWGAKAVVDLLQGDGLSFCAAQKKLQPRPWLCDDFDTWLNRLKSEQGPHQCACIFVDNSGADFVLGIIPFTRELLKRGTKVILCANSLPAVNDVTFPELQSLIDRVALICPEIKEALNHDRLRIADSGQRSPCLDLSRIDGSLADLVRDWSVDLVVIEGMGRAIHTNFSAQFNCESIKVAVVKNKWLANKLGGEIFSVIFKYEIPTIALP